LAGALRLIVTPVRLSKSSCFSTSQTTANVISLAVVVILPRLLLAHGSLTNFGCDSARLSSPDGSHVLVWQAAAKGCNADHTLLLSDANGGRERVLLEHDVPVNVSWSPDSNHFLVDDHHSSDFDGTYIFSTDRSKVDLFKRMEKTPDPFARKHLHAGHVSLEGLRWIDSSHILMELTGHFEERPAAQFEACYVADAQGRVRRLQVPELRLYPECGSAPLH
jgi:hypothetical protein